MCHLGSPRARMVCVMAWWLAAAGLVVVGLSNTPRAGVTGPWLLTWAGWQYLGMLAYLTMALVRTTCVFRRHRAAAGGGHRLPLLARGGFTSGPLADTYEDAYDESTRWSEGDAPRVSSDDAGSTGDASGRGGYPSLSSQLHGHVRLRRRPSKWAGHRQYLISNADRRLRFVCRTMKSVCTVVCIGYWAVQVPLGIVSGVATDSLVRTHASAGWPYLWPGFCADFMLHGLPLLFGLLYPPTFVHGEEPHPSYRAAVGGVLAYCGSYVLLCACFAVVGGEAPYVTEFMLSPPVAILLLCVYLLFLVPGACARVAGEKCRARRAKRKRDAKRAAAPLLKASESESAVLSPDDIGDRATSFEVVSTREYGAGGRRSAGSGHGSGRRGSGSGTSRGADKAAAPLLSRKASTGPHGACKASRREWACRGITIGICACLVCALVLGLRAAIQPSLPLHGITVSGTALSRFDGWNHAMASAWVQGQDGGASVVLDAGATPGTSQAVWLFGDTGTTNGWLISNTAMLVTVQEGSGPVANRTSFQYFDNSDGHATAVLPFTATEQGAHWALWPSVGFSVGNASYSYFELLPRASSTFMASKFIVARSWGNNMVYERMVDTVPMLPYGVVRRRMANGSLVPAAAAGGDAASVDPTGGDGWLYYFFIRRPSVGGSNVYLARLPVADVVSQNQPFEYWRGGRAADSFGGLDKVASPPLVTGVFAQLTVSFNKHLGKYVMYQVGLFGDWHSLYVRASGEPWGPWGPPVHAFSQTFASGSGPFSFSNVFYCPYVHPEMDSGGGKEVYVTHSGMESGIDALVKLTFDSSSASA